MTTDIPDISALAYEEARDRLAEVVRALEAGNVPLEQALALWERGEALAAHCQHLLDGARRRLDDARAAARPAADLNDHPMPAGDHPAGDQPTSDEE